MEAEVAEIASTNSWGLVYEVSLQCWWIFGKFFKRCSTAKPCLFSAFLIHFPWMTCGQIPHCQFKMRRKFRYKWSLLQKIRHLSLNHDLTTLEANKPINRVLNRYRDVLPYDHSRVVLWDCEATDYINASLVEVSQWSQDVGYTPYSTSCVLHNCTNVYKSSKAADIYPSRWMIYFCANNHLWMLLGTPSQQKVYFGPRPLAHHPRTFLVSRVAEKHKSCSHVKQDHREGCSQMSSVLASQCWRLLWARIRGSAIDTYRVVTGSALHCQNFQINKHRDRWESGNFPLPLHQLAGFWSATVSGQFSGVSASCARLGKSGWRGGTRCCPLFSGDWKVGDFLSGWHLFSFGKCLFMFSIEGV